MSMQARIALVTGASRGIGRAIVHELARRGAYVVGTATSDQGAEQIGQGLAAAGLAGEGLRLDVTDPAQVEAVVGAVLGRHGRIDILVNNAGIQHVAPVEEFPVERWDAIIAINLSSAFHTTRLALPAMKAANWGRIINVASVHGLVASAQKSAYVAAKHGLVGLTKVVALETATTGVTCNAICPGWVLTPLVQKQVDA
ncbi:MAG: 3-hydroxybutyrate dehydrogenase, partial [Thiobacillaceae bacterium]|nr:3-hydroxybutyrate dehydrogenase [Thiobacillaceae bacterium]